MLFSEKSTKFSANGPSVLNRSVDSGKAFLSALKRSTISSIFPFLATHPEERTILSTDSAQEGNMLGVCWLAQSPISWANDGLLKEIRSSLSLNLPRGAFIQFIRMDIPDISPIVDRYSTTVGSSISSFYHDKPEKRDLYHQLLSRTVRFTDGLVDRPAFTGSLIHLSQQYLLVTINIPVPEVITDEVYANTLLSFNSFESSMPSLGLRRMDAGEFLSFWRRFLHYYSPWDNYYNEDLLLRDQIAFPGDGLFDKHGHVLSTTGSDDPDVIITPLSIKEWPDKEFYHPEVDFLMGDPLGVMPGCPDPILLSWTAHIPDYHSKLNAMKRKQAAINYQAFGPMLKFVPALAYRKKGIDALMEFVESENDLILETALTALIFSRSIDDAARSVSSFQTMSRQRGLGMQVDDLIPLPAIMNSLPLFASEESIAMTARFRTLSSTQAASVTPVFGDWSGPGAIGQLAIPGAGTLVQTRRGHPSLIDIFSSLSNFNFSISGAAGSGKSVLAQQLIRDQALMGTQVFVIETGESFKKQCAAMMGTHIYFDDTTDINLNPFHMIEDFEDEVEQLTALHALMISHTDALSKEDLTFVAEAVRQTFVDRGKDATPTDVQKFLFRGNDRAQMMGRMMSDFTEGRPYGHIFTGTREIDLSDDFVVLELGALEGRPALQAVVLAQFMFAIQRQIYLGNLKTNRRRMFFVDEASVLFKDDAFAEFLAQGYRRARKHKASFGTGTQNIDDLHLSASTEVMAAQSAHFFYLSQNPEAINIAIKNKHLDADSYLTQLLRSLRKSTGYSEFVYQHDGSPGVFRLILDPYNLALASSSGAAREVIMAAIDRGTDPDKAVRDYLDQAKPGWQELYPPLRKR